MRDPDHATLTTVFPKRRRANDTAAMRTAGILGAGGYVPDTVLSNHDLEKMVDTSDEWIFARTGMRARRIASPEQATSDMAAAAATRALEDAGLAAQDIDLILVATVTPDHMCPSAAAIVQHEIGAVDTPGFDINAGCTGFVHGMSIGAQFIAGGVYEHVLVIGAEKLSTIMDYEDRESCILFGDGAGAVVLGADADGEILDCHLGLDGSEAQTIWVPAGGSRLPATEATVAERRHFVRLQGRRVYRFAVSKFCSEIEGLAERKGIAVSDIDWIVPHQANQRITEAAATQLGVPMEKVVCNIEQYGNTSSASIPIALAEAVDDGKIQPGQLVALVAFGAGLTWGSALVRW